MLETQDAVLAIPGRHDWNRSQNLSMDHRKQMWIAGVVLFFKCNFRGPGPQDKPIPCVLALVSRLREFTAPDPRIYSAILYECYPTRDLRVIPAANIITRACLAPCFLAGMSQYHTIPRLFEGLQRQHFDGGSRQGRACSSWGRE